MGIITRNAANNITTGGVILPAGINNTSVASISELEQVATGGGLNLISSQTASASASIEFTSGIDSTYDIYKFELINIHAATNDTPFTFNASTDGGSNYNVIKTTTRFTAGHSEADTYNVLSYQTGADRAQSTSYQEISQNMGNQNDENGSGELYLFAPSSTTFVKHFMCRFANQQHAEQGYDDFTAGYFNTTSAVDAVDFKFESGNIDAGTIRLYGIESS
jgi:hypothetical protein